MSMSSWNRITYFAYSLDKWSVSIILKRRYLVCRACTQVYIISIISINIDTETEILLASSLSIWPTIIYWCSENLTKSVSDWFAKFRCSWKSENWKAFCKVDFQQEVSCWQLHYLPLWPISRHIYMSTGFCAPPIR